MIWEPFKTQGSGLEGGWREDRVDVQEETWGHSQRRLCGGSTWQGQLPVAPVARDVLAPLCCCVTSASAPCRCTWPFAERVWLLPKPQSSCATEPGAVLPWHWRKCWVSSL